MTISYTIQPIPFWYFADLNGKPLAGGKIYSFSSLDISQSKPIYQDSSGTNQFPNPAILDETGTIGPLYFKVDSDNPDDLYFLQIFNSQGVLVRSINNYPISSGGGGGPINTVQNIENIFTNSSFIDNIGSTSVQPIQNNTFLCPSSNSGLYFPDITFIQSGASDAQDTITFSQFMTGTNPITPDFVPPYFLNYTCLNTPSGEVFKGIRIPLSPFVNSTANQLFTFVIWARSNSGGDTLSIQSRQYFGTGGSPSSDQVTSISTITLSNSFAQYNLNFSLPSISGKILGNSNDDGVYVEILFPTSTETSIDIIKPQIYEGSVFPSVTYENIQEIEAKLECPRTGDIRESYNLFSTTPVQAGWIPLNDGTIGNSSSNATNRANSDTWLLYNLLWNNTSDTDCPIYNSSGTLVSKGGTSISDWNANNQLQLPLVVGKVVANKGGSGFSSYSQSYTSSGNNFTVSTTSGLRTGYPIVLSGGSAPSPLSNGITYFCIVINSTTIQIATSSDNAINNVPLTLTSSGNGTVINPPPYALGNSFGETVHQDTQSEMPSHVHGPGAGSSFLVNGGGTVAFQVNGVSRVLAPSTTAAAGGNFPHNNVQPTTICNMIIKL